MNHFVNWAEKLPENFANLNYDTQFDIVQELVEEVGYSFWETDYPWDEDINQNTLPNSLLKYLCVRGNYASIIVFKNYFGECRNELAISALTSIFVERDVEDAYFGHLLGEPFITVGNNPEDLLESILTNVSTLESNDALGEALIYYSNAWGGLDNIPNTFISLCKIKLPENLIEYFWKEIKELTAPALAGDLAGCPNLPPNIIIEMFKHFRQLDDDLYFDEKVYLYKVLSNHSNTPAPVCSAIKEWKERLEI